jgi:hypothetical protein
MAPSPITWSGNKEPKGMGPWLFVLGLPLLLALTLGTPVTTDPQMKETALERQLWILCSHRWYR